MASKVPTLARPWTTGNCRFEIGTGSLGLADGLLASDIAVGAPPGGHAVNLASRLEGQCKTCGAAIIVGEATVAAAPDTFTCPELDLIRVKGKRQPARIIALFGNAELTAELTRDTGVAEVFTGLGALLAAYRKQAWDEALSALGPARRHACLLTDRRTARKQN